MSNLLKMVTGLMSDGMVGKVASLIGANSGVARTALTTLMPKILKGIASKGATESGAGSLLSMIKDHGLGGGDMDMSAGLMDKGAKMNDAIFGSSMKDMAVPGVSGEAKSKLMNLATPMALGSLGKLVKDKNLDAKGLSSYLQEQSKGAASTVTGAASRATSAASSTASSVSSTAQKSASGGMGFLKWALPLLLLLGAGYFFMNKSGAEAEPVKTNAQPVQKTTTTATKTTHTHADGTVHQGATHGTTAAGAATDAAGNMIDKAKGAAGAAGDAAKNAAGGVMDKAKGAAGAAGDAAKNAAGGMMDKAKDAAGAADDAAGGVMDKAKGAAGAAGDAAKNAAGGMMDKAKGAAGDAAKGATGKAGDVLDAAKKGMDAAAGAAGAKDIKAGGGN